METSFHHSELKKKRVRALSKKITAYSRGLSKLIKKNDYALHESALYIAGDERYQRTFTDALSPYLNTKHVIVVGIGGSSLGIEAVYQALANSKSPTLTVIDGIEREAVEAFEETLKEVSNPGEIVVTIISKSGTTTETMLNAAKVVELCEERFGEGFRTQIICIGNENTPLHEIAKEKEILYFSIPDAIGGRYSLFTAVGMVPLTLLKIDTKGLREGALDAVSKTELKLRAQNALHLALEAEKGVHTVNFFTFNKRLELCGYWYRQLLAESIGKKMTTEGTTFSHQLLPVVTTSIDLHSMAQLYLGGYKNIFTHFVYYNERHPFHVHTKHWLLTHMPFLGGKKFSEVTNAIVEGVLHAYNDQKLPYQYTELSQCSAYEVGFLLSSLMCEMMYLGHILNVDPFDQPSVELYKKYTRKALS